MAAEALRGGAPRRGAYRRLGQALAYGHLRKSTGRLGSGLLRVQIGLRWSATGSMAGCNTRFIKEHKPSNHIRARIKSHVYTTE